MQGLAEREDLGRDAWGVHGVEGQGGKCDGPCSHLNSVLSVYILDFGTGYHLVKEFHYFKKKKSLGHRGGSIG